MTIKRELTPDRLGHIAGVAPVALQQGTTSTPETLESISNKLTTVNYVWNPSSLQYEAMVQPSTGGGASGSTSVSLPEFLSAVVQEVGNPAFILSAAALRTKIDQAAQVVIDGMKAETTRVM